MMKSKMNSSVTFNRQHAHL